MLRVLGETLYRSAGGRFLSFCAHLLGRLQQPFMIYGVKDPVTRTFRRFTRMSSTATILHRERLAISDHVWVGHYSVLDATGGLTIGDGVQIGVGACIYSHGSQNSIRLLGREYVNISEDDRSGYVRATVSIGSYTFIGSGAIILPGVRIGSGSIIGPNAIVMTDVPDRAILMVTPSRVMGDTLASDLVFVKNHGVPPHYYDPEALRSSLGTSN